TGGHLVAGVQMDLAPELGLLLVALADGQPACGVNPAINKAGTCFAFLPSGCRFGVNCREIRALVLALNNVTPIPDGAHLFTVALKIGDHTLPGTYRISVSNMGASSPEGSNITLAAIQGSVRVVPKSSSAVLALKAEPLDTGGTARARHPLLKV